MRVRDQSVKRNDGYEDDKEITAQIHLTLADLDADLADGTSNFYIYTLNLSKLHLKTNRWSKMDEYLVYGLTFLLQPEILSLCVSGKENLALIPWLLLNK